MKTVWTVARKELVDLFRDRRTMLISLLMGPVLVPLLVLGMGAMLESRMRTQFESTLQLPVVGAEHAPSLVAFLKGRNIDPQPAPEDPDAMIREQQADVILRIDPEFGERWRSSRPARVELIYDSSRQDSQIPVSRLQMVLTEYSGTVGALRGISRGVSPESQSAVQVARRDVATPESRQGRMLMFLPYFLVFFSFLGGAHLAMDSTAGERERQSLEPLLATPAARAAIMSGKILGACLFGVLSLLLMLAAFKLSLNVAPGAMQLINMSVPMMAMLLLVLLPMVMIGTTLLTLISATVKSMKEAQGYMSVLMLLPMVPTLLLWVNPVRDELWQFAVPFLAQNQMIMKLVRGDMIGGAEWAVYVGAGLGTALLLWIVASRLYLSEKLAVSA
ncbi:MAG: ABC transporter permease [Luteimonas sp.]